MRFSLSLAITAHLAQAVVYREDVSDTGFKGVSANTYPMVFPWGHAGNAANAAG